MDATGLLLGARRSRHARVVSLACPPSRAAADSAFQLNQNRVIGVIAQITPLVLTFNEAPNIGRVLRKLSWARRIVVVDSGSNDGTLEVISRFPQAEVYHRSFDSAAEQCNF